MSAYSDYKSGAIEEWQYRAICRMEEGEENREPNPCEGCPNFEVEEDEAGEYAYCILENCDRKESEEEE